MTITDAVKQANTEHVVYFLLMAYVEALGYTGRSSVPAPVKRLPIVTRTDVNERLHVLREALASPASSGPDARPVIEEAADLFSAASEQLNTLNRPEHRQPANAASHSPLRTIWPQPCPRGGTFVLAAVHKLRA